MREIWKLVEKPLFSGGVCKISYIVVRRKIQSSISLQFFPLSIIIYDQQEIHQIAVCLRGYKNIGPLSVPTFPRCLARKTGFCLGCLRACIGPGKTPDAWKPVRTKVQFGLALSNTLSSWLTTDQADEKSQLLSSPWRGKKLTLHVMPEIFCGLAKALTSVWPLEHL